MTAPATAAPSLSPSRAPAHRDANVLRWLAAFTASLVGDAVWFLALSWAATAPGTPGGPAWSSRRPPCRARC